MMRMQIYIFYNIIYITVLFKVLGMLKATTFMEFILKPINLLYSLMDSYLVPQ